MRGDATLMLHLFYAHGTIKQTCLTKNLMSLLLNVLFKRIITSSNDNTGEIF